MRFISLEDVCGCVCVQRVGIGLVLQLRVKGWMFDHFLRQERCLLQLDTRGYPPAQPKAGTRQRRPGMSALLASAARFYASTFDCGRRRLQVMARRGVATLIEVASCVVSSFTCFDSILFICLFENMILEPAFWARITR